ncbi:MAG: formate dehydrogenase subunit alpha [Rhodocyclaceae bacterium]|nr:formate dehydrogenase subunit alpha [Rhodocyclaceae bacterium]
MSMLAEPLVQRTTVEFTLDGEKVTAFADQTLIEIAKEHGKEIPHLCYKPGYRPDGNCRACVVEIKGERVLAPSCCRHPSNNMDVSTDSPRALHSQKMVLELLNSDAPDKNHKPQKNELSKWSAKLGVTESRFASKVAKHPAPARDYSHPAMSVNLDACIQCTRCVRACREEQNNDVIGYAFRGAESKIVFDFDDPMGASTCVACGECVQACPTGALAPAKEAYAVVADKKVDSVCPYCGVGCQLTYHIKDNKIIRVEGRDGPANQSRLCVKGRFGFDYAHHKQRLTTPLIRKEGVLKNGDFRMDPENWRDVFREATWEEALDLAGGTLAKIRDQHGPKSLAGFGSAKGSNEEAYLFQKLVRVGFGSNNVDHCTRLCHASSVAALLEGVGSGAVSNQVGDVENAEVIFVIGANPTSNHPVAATWIKNAANRNAKLIVADPRLNDLYRHAWRYLQFKPDMDVAMLNAMIHTIIEEGLVDEDFIKNRTENYEALKANAKEFSPEKMAPLCGIPAETLREVARAYATSKASIILWGMGISQHVHGTDNARCLIALTLMTGQVGKPGSGLHPLRGQNNVQGASDAGLIPMMFPDYKRVDNPENHARFEKLWNTKLDDKPGLTVVEIIDAACDGSIKGMYVMGENPAMSDPDSNHARAGLANLEMLVVQDIFLTETAYLADVVLPASAWPEKMGTVTNTDRMVQLGRRALDCPGEAKQDLWIIQQLAKRLGLDWNYIGEESGVAAVYEEMHIAQSSISGISWDRLNRESSVTYPCKDDNDPGQPVVFIDKFPTASGRAKFVPADIIPANERPDTEFPFVLITGRQLEHWHTGSMTRRASVLDVIEPSAVVSMNPIDMRKVGVAPGEIVTIASRRGEVDITVRADEGTPVGSVFMPFAFYEAPANMLTNRALDPFGKIAELKYCAVSVTKGAELVELSSYGGGMAFKNTDAAA